MKRTISEDWLNSKDRALIGFKWTAGTDPVTSGINVWSEIFTYDFDDDRKVAIILIDTQGTFDHKTSIENCTMIFALSTLLSSVQIFNVMQNIQENDLQHLQLFSEFGKLAAKNAGNKPFQKLHFLVRDWSYHTEYSYGSEGGSKYLQKCFDISQNEEQHKSLRNHIRECFEEISCFLMPHPGFAVSESHTFSGNLSDIRQSFKDQLKLLVPQLLAPENLTIKMINGRSVIGENFLEYFEQYFNAFQNKIPTPMTIMDANARVQNNCVVKEIEMFYYTKVTSLNCTLREYSRKLGSVHSTAKQEAFKLLVANPLIGSSNMTTDYQDKLNSFIENTYQELLANHKHNESKLIQVKKYYSNKVASFDGAVDRYLDLLRTEHEIAKRKAFDMLHEQILAPGPCVYQIFEAELIVHIKNEYMLVIREFQSNKRAVALSQERYLARLELFHCKIEHYIDQLAAEQEKAQENAKQLIFTNPLKGNAQMIANFNEKLEEFFGNEHQRLINLFKRSNQAVKESKSLYMASMSEIDFNCWKYVEMLKTEHQNAKNEAVDSFRTKVSFKNTQLSSMFQKQLLSGIDEHFHVLIRRYRSMCGLNLIRLGISYWDNLSSKVQDFLEFTCVTSSTTAAVIVAAPVEIALIPAAVVSIIGYFGYYAIKYLPNPFARAKLTAPQ